MLEKNEIIQSALRNLKIEELNPMQEASLEQATGRKDVILLSPTGCLLYTSLDTKKQILAALNIKNVEDADAEYQKYVKGDMLMNVDGTLTENTGEFARCV